MRKLLRELDPHWLFADKLRYQVGVQFKCPAHEECLIVLPFLRPDDGYPPIETTLPLYTHTSSWLETMTIREHVAHEELIMVVTGGVVLWGYLTDS